MSFRLIILIDEVQIVSRIDLEEDYEMEKNALEGRWLPVLWTDAGLVHWEGGTRRSFSDFSWF